MILVDGGEGRDTASYLGGTNGITADLAAGFAEGEGSDRLLSVENLLGSLLSDYLRGDPGPNNLNGGPGDDVIEARDGDDALIGGDGVDSGDGGNGIDNCSEGRERVQLRIVKRRAWAGPLRTPLSEAPPFARCA